jgi:hypothetical protein
MLPPAAGAPGIPACTVEGALVEPAALVALGVLVAPVALGVLVAVELAEPVLLWAPLEDFGVVSTPAVGVVVVF